MNNDTRRMVIVIGAGRSGTSMLMQILVGMGMQVSGNLIPANISNPEGFFEDMDIKEIQADLYACLHVPSVVLPLPEGWLSSDCVKKAKSNLSDVVQRLLDEHPGILGIKDPRISTFLPLWTRVFNPMRIVPSFIVAVREPQSVISSFIRQYNDPGHVAELVWLLRTLEAIENTAADCFVAHYEDWFDQPLPLAQGLLHYTGLDAHFQGDLKAVLAQKVKPNLNRASQDDYEVQNPYVHKLYAALQQCRGADFDRERLMAVVKECRQAMEGFKGWHQLAHQANRKLADHQNRLEKLTAEAAKVKTLEARIRELEAEKSHNEQWVQQVQKLERQFDQMMAIKLDAS